MSDFADITIVDFDVDRTELSPTAPGLRHMYFRLSAAPPGEWIELFDSGRRTPEHATGRHVWTDGDHIVVDCAPEEIEAQLAALKHDVAGANIRYHQIERKGGRQRELEEEAAVIEKQRLEELRKRLSF